MLEREPGFNPASAEIASGPTLDLVRRQETKPLAEPEVAPPQEESAETAGEVAEGEVLHPETGSPISAESSEKKEEEPTADWRERSHFSELRPELQSHYRELIATKLEYAKETTPPERIELITNLLSEVAGKLHVNLRDGREPDRASHLLGEIIKGIVLEPEDRQFDNGELYIGGNLNGKIHLYPKFFGETNDGRIQFDREHVIAHELGGLLRGCINLEDYQAFRTDSEYALDGDYVNSFSNEDEKKREEFEETAADFFRSTNAVGMLLRRFERYKNEDEREQLLGDVSEDGPKREQFRALLEESHRLRTFFQDRLKTIAEKSENDEELEALWMQEEMMGESQMMQMAGPTGGGESWRNNWLVQFLERLAN